MDRKTNLCNYLAIFLISLLVLGTMGVAIHRVHRVDTHPGFALDDSWIHATMARNLITGNGYGINANQWLPTSTAPAWTLLMAFVMLFVRDPVISGYIASAICQLAATILIYKITFRWTENIYWSLLPAVLLTLNPIILWGYPSGMELPMVTLSIVLCLYVFDATKPNSTGRKVLLPLTLLLCALSRPSLFVLAPLALVMTAYQNYREGESIKSTAQIFAIQSAIFVIGILPYFAFNYATTRHIFPTAFHVKVELRDVGISSAIATRDWAAVKNHILRSSTAELNTVLSFFMRQNMVLFMLVPLGFASFFKPLRKDNIGTVGMISCLVMLPLIMGIVSPSNRFSNYAYRYFAPYVPGFTLLGCLGVWAVWKHFRLRALAIILLSLMIIPTTRNFRSTLVRFAQDVKNTNALYVESGKWIRDNIDQSITVAVNDIGGIAYYADNHILDIMGLGSLEIWPALKGTGEDGRITPQRAEAIKRFLYDNEIEYLVISPHYYPVFHRNTEVFEEIKRWEGAFPTHRHIDPQILYRINWANSAFSSAVDDT